MPSPYTQSQSPTAFPNQRTSVARDPQDPESLPKKRRRFETTHWSLIREAQETLSPGSQAALKTLCQTYWFPVGSAEDLTRLLCSTPGEEVSEGCGPGSGPLPLFPAHGSKILSGRRMGPADRPEERWRGYPDRTRFRRRSSPPPGAKTGSDTGGGVRAAMGLHSVRPSHGAIARRVSPTRSAGELRDPERLPRRSPRVVSDRCRRTAGDHPGSCAGPSPSASEEVWTFIARQNRRHRGRSQRSG